MSQFTGLRLERLHFRTALSATPVHTVSLIAFCVKLPTKWNPINIVIYLNEPQLADFVAVGIWNPDFDLDRMKLRFSLLVVHRVRYRYKLLGRFQFGELDRIECVFDHRSVLEIAIEESVHILQFLLQLRGKCIGIGIQLEGVRWATVRDDLEDAIYILLVNQDETFSE